MKENYTCVIEPIGITEESEFKALQNTIAYMHKNLGSFGL